MVFDISRAMQKEKSRRISQVTLDKYKGEYSEELERKAALEAILKSLDVGFYR